MHTCEHCGEEVYRTHGGWSSEFDGWLCEHCYSELKGEE